MDVKLMAGRFVSRKISQHKVNVDLFSEEVLRGKRLKSPSLHQIPTTKIEHENARLITQLIALGS